MRKEPSGTHDVPSESRLAEPPRSAERDGRMRRALAGTPVTVFSQDETLRYDWIYNPTPAFAEDAVLGRTDAEILDPASAEALTAVKRAALTTGEPQRATLRARPIAGGPEGVFDLHVEPLRDGDGAITGIICAAVDVSELHAEAMAARRAENRFRAAVEAMMDPFGIYAAVRDASGRIVDFRVEYVNEAACEANMMSREEQVGHLLCEILPNHRENGLFEAYCRVVETGEPLRRQEETVEGGWGTRHLRRAFDIVAARHEDGFVATWRDVSERRRQELALTAALRESDLLRREIEHRVSNNLQLLSALIGMAAREAGPGVAEALRGARRKVEMVGSLHALLSTTPDRPGEVALDGFVTRICEAMRAGLGLRQRGIELEASTIPVRLGANEAILLGLLVNELVTNAAKHAFTGREAGRISVAFSSEADELVLTVRDDGIGIAPEAAGSGGWGMQLARRFAGQLGGELACDTSDAGTTFRLAVGATGRTS